MKLLSDDALVTTPAGASLRHVVNARRDTTPKLYTRLTPAGKGASLGEARAARTKVPRVAATKLYPHPMRRG